MMSMGPDSHRVSLGVMGLRGPRNGPAVEVDIVERAP